MSVTETAHSSGVENDSAEQKVDQVESGRIHRRLGPGRPIRFGLAVGPVVLIALWSLGSAAGWISSQVLPAPWVVVSTAGELLASGRLQEALAVSGIRALGGLLTGVLAGLVLAVISGLSRLGEALFDGPVLLNRAIPSLALMPLLILWFGIGETMKVITIALAVMVHIYIHTHDGLRSIDQRYVELAETLRLNRWTFLRRVVLPGALPGFLMGMRLAVTSAWLALVVVEQVNAFNGIGHMITLAGQYGQTDILVVGLVLYGVLGLGADMAVRFVQRRALAWRRTLNS